MYTEFLLLHNILRWLILLGLVTTLIRYLVGWLDNQVWKKSDHLLGVVITWMMYLQLITGLVLYFFLSRLTKMAFADFSAAMKDDNLRFYAVEHISLMVIAVALVHMGWVKSKKAKTDLSKFKTASIFYLIALMVIFAAIPWGRL